MARTAPTTKKTTAKKKTPAKKATRKRTAKTTSASSTLSLAEEQAGALTQAALWLDQASSAQELGSALEHNMDVWVGIKTMTESPSCPLPTETRGNLIQLADYVVGATLQSAKVPLTDDKLLSFVNINLQISEGLLEGYTIKLIQEEAYSLWEASGCPTGKDQEYWFTAEERVREKIEKFQKDYLNN